MTKFRLVLRLTLINPWFDRAFAVLADPAHRTILARLAGGESTDRAARMPHLHLEMEHGAGDTIVALFFRAVEGRTEFTLRQEGFSSAGERDHHTNGWNRCLDKLGPYLETGKNQIG